MSVIAGNFNSERRAELARFLRNRRERVTPADVGLPPGSRRRTPGLRREEVAQLAGVGVTWYTWLEQGRPINASVQVLDAIAAVLRMGTTERWHLYRLAELPGVPTARSDQPVPPDVLAVMDAVDPAPAAVYNGRYDLLAFNESFAAIFPTLVEATGIERNALWQMYSRPEAVCPIRDVDVRGSIVATLRANYAGHVGDPDWTELIEVLCAASTEFRTFWDEQRIPDETRRPVAKAFECFDVGTVRVRASGFPIPPTLDCRMVISLPETAADAALIQRLIARNRRPARAARAAGSAS